MGKSPLTFLVAQQVRQSDGKIHVTAGAYLQGYVQLTVREGKEFRLSQLSLSLHQVETVTNDVGDTRKKKEVYQQHICYSCRDPAGRIWSPGVYRFKFRLPVPQQLLPTFTYQTEYGEEAKRFFFLMTSFRASHQDMAQTDTEVVDEVVRVDLQRFQKSWKGHATTEIVMHMFRKLPAMLKHAADAEVETQKSVKSLLKASNKVSCSVELESGGKKAFFLRYDTVPIVVRILNPAQLKLKDVSVVLEQDIFHRLKTKAKGTHFVRSSVWEKKVLVDQKQTECRFAVPVSLQSTKLVPTILKTMQTLIYVRHSVRVKIKTPGKDMSDLQVRLPVIIVEPPIEHLAKALKKRYLEQNKAPIDTEAAKKITTLSEEVTSLREQQASIMAKLQQQEELVKANEAKLERDAIQYPKSSLLRSEQLEVDVGNSESESSQRGEESSASATSIASATSGASASGTSASASESRSSARRSVMSHDYDDDSGQGTGSVVVEDLEDGSCLVLASTDEFYRNLNAAN